MEDLIDTISLGVSPSILSRIQSNTIDLTVTSPPYDDLRKYNSEPIFDFKATAKELYRITAVGGVLVWVVADQTIKGSESLSSFKQAIFFKEECGFRLHDTMIYAKTNPTPMTHNRYEQQFEYMFVLSKGKPKTFNPLMIPLKTKRKPQIDVHHEKNYRRGASKRGHKAEKIAFNIWHYQVGKYLGSMDEEAWIHPASFPEKLAADHIYSWSKPRDIVLDPFCGSGTTCKMAMLAGRRYIGFDASEEYVEVARKRLSRHLALQQVSSCLDLFPESLHGFGNTVQMDRVQGETNLVPNEMEHDVYQGQTQSEDGVFGSSGA